MDTQVGNPDNSYLAIAVVVAIVLSAYAAWRRSRAAKRFATSNLAAHMLPPSRLKLYWFSSALVAAVLGLITLAVMDIRWGKTTREVPQKGLEVVFALDVSRSMLAEDVAPSRLQRAKQQISDMIDEMSGDRIALVIFAGDALQSVPLTNHYDDFRQTLESVGPQSLNRGGSRLGEAIRVSTEAFITKTNDHKAIVLFTDGEDQESEPIDAARTAFADRGIRIFTVGLGDIDQGAVVPLSGEDQYGRPMPSYLRYQGEIVRTKLDGKVLSQIATETEGAYIPAGVRQVNMADVYHKYVARIGQAEFETAKAETYAPRFQWFAAPALFLLFIEVFVSTRRRSKTGDLLAQAKSTANVIGRAACVLLFVAGPSSSYATEVDPAQTINEANKLVRDGKIDEALAKYAAIDPRSGRQDVLEYDLGVAKYRAGDLQAAADLFAAAAGSEDSQIAARSRFNLGNCCYADALGLAETDKEAAIKKLKEAISHYRGSLAGDPDHADTRANIELAVNLIRKLQEEESKKDEQKSQDSKQEQEPQQQPDDKSESDQKPDGENQSASSDNQQSQEQSQESEDQSSNDQSSSNQDSGSQSDEGQESKPEPDAASKKMNDAENADSASTTEQDQAKDAGEQGDRKSEPEESQPKPSEEQNPETTSQEQSSAAAEEKEQSGKTDSSGELSAADESTATDASKEGGSNPNDKAPPRYLTREEAMKMLQAVRDREMLRRLQMEQARQAQRFNVEKDW